MEFVHLRMYTEYSLNKGINKINDIIREYNNDKQKFGTITDINNLFGCIDFYKNCIKNKIKPIIGCEILINNNYGNKPFKILLLIKNKTGYSNLSKLISRASLYNDKKNNLYTFKKDWFKSSLNKGLILITGNLDSDIGFDIINNNKFYKTLKFWMKIFKKRLFLDVQYYDKKNKDYNKNLIYISKKFKIPLVCTHPIFFLKKNEILINKIKYCIFKKINLNKLENIKIFHKNQYFHKKKKIKKFFKNNTEILKNTIKVAKMCNLILNLNKIKIPYYKLKKTNVNKKLIKISLKGIKKFIKINNQNNFEEIFLKYKKRLFKECEVIINMGFSDYFLIVKNFVEWSRRKGIIVGPGRGSGSGSLVSFSMNITKLDPIKYNLLFERFLNYERISLPDFDIDFCQDKRELVMNYVKYRYGINYVSQIITFGKMAVKASIRDVGRILNFNYDFIDKIAKLIPFKLKNNFKIKDIINNNYNLNKIYNENIEVKNIIDIAIKTEGLIKSIGVHAGGLLISSIKIYNICPIYLQNNIIVNQYKKDDSELIGLIKFDFLGLTTLSIIKDCLMYIKKKFYINNNLLNKINLKDKLCFYNLQKANTEAIFQLESNGMKNMLIKAHPENFENIISLISLYRPGPISLLDSFCLRKNGKEKINYFHLKLKDVLNETYGIIIYQEQVMKIVELIGNYSLTEADILRRLISKKDSVEIKRQKDKFINRGLKNNIKKDKLLEIYNIIEKFSNYGFNKSHAAAYSLISYYTLWLKTYFVNDFMCFNLSYFYIDINKIYRLIKNSINNNIYILPININKSNFNFLSFEKKILKIRYGFSSIKGIGLNAYNYIENLRKIKLFKNFDDFYFNINKNIINQKIIETLICSGAFDSLNNNRAYLLEKYLSKKKSLISKKKNNKENLIFKKKYLNKIFKIKKNIFWKFKIKSIEENYRFGFFFINNLYNIYKNKVNYVLYKNKIKNFIFGILYKIEEKSNNINNKFFLLNIVKNYDNLEIKINENLYIYYKEILKIYNFLIFFYENNFLNIKKIIKV